MRRMSKQTSKLGRNLRPGDVIRLYDETQSPRKVATAEVTDVYETRPGTFTGRRRWHVCYRVLKVSRGAWLYHYSECYSDDRYELAN